MTERLFSVAVSVMSCHSRRPPALPSLDRYAVSRDPVFAHIRQITAGDGRRRRHPAGTHSSPLPSVYGGDVTIDFGLARGIDAQSFGQPGQRTFRLRILGADGQSASLWVEKDHLQALSLALKQMLAQLEYDQQPPPADAGDFPMTAEHDFRVGRMGMGFNHADRTIVLFTYELGAEDEDEATLGVRLTQEQSASLGVQLDEIIAGGRPVCPLCGLAMEPGGHACIRANGHSKQPIPEQDSGEETT
jgi:uncharacterized repeat protein (TIGR03847 family)